MAFFQGGTTYAPSGQVTAANLNALINAAIPLNHNRDHFATDSKIVTVASGIMANATTGELQWDTNDGILYVYVTPSQRVGIAPQSLRVFTAQSSVSVGDVVVLDTVNTSSVKTTTNAAGLEEVIGVSRSNATTGQSVLVQVADAGLVNCTTGAVAIGAYLAKSTTAGKAEATTSGNGFAIALSSKDGGSEGQITALLGQKTPGRFAASFAAYTMTSASLTNGTWYDVPSSAVGSSITTDGTSRMKVTVYTSRADQPVTLTIQDFKMVSGTVANIFTGIRIVLNTSTVVFGGTTDGTTSDVTPNATGEKEYIGMGTVIYQKASSYEMATKSFSVTFTIPTAGTNTVGLQFLGRPDTTASYTTTNPTTATIAVVVH